MRRRRRRRTTDRVFPTQKPIQTQPTPKSPPILRCCCSFATHHPSWFGRQHHKPAELYLYIFYMYVLLLLTLLVSVLKWEWAEWMEDRNFQPVRFSPSQLSTSSLSLWQNFKDIHCWLMLMMVGELSDFSQKDGVVAAVGSPSQHGVVVVFEKKERHIRFVLPFSDYKATPFLRSLLSFAEDAVLMVACLPASLYLHTHIYGKPAGRDVLGNNNLNNNNNVLKKRKNLQNGTSSTDSMLMISRRRSNTNHPGSAGLRPCHISRRRRHYGIAETQYRVESSREGSELEKGSGKWTRTKETKD